MTPRRYVTRRRCAVRGARARGAVLHHGGRRACCRRSRSAHWCAGEVRDRWRCRTCTRPRRTTCRASRASSRRICARRSSSSALIPSKARARARPAQRPCSSACAARPSSSVDPELTRTRRLTPRPLRLHGEPGAEFRPTRSSPSRRRSRRCSTRRYRDTRARPNRHSKTVPGVGPKTAHGTRAQGDSQRRGPAVLPAPLLRGPARDREDRVAAR